MKDKIPVKSLVLGGLFGAVVAFSVVFVMLPPKDDPCTLHIKNTGTNAVFLCPSGGDLPVHIAFRFGFLPVPERKQFLSLILEAGHSGSMSYGPGGTILVLAGYRPRPGRFPPPRFRPVWTGRARTVLAEVNADDITNITFQVTSQSQ